jgi:hypothetical protein
MKRFVYGPNRNIEKYICHAYVVLSFVVIAAYRPGAQVSVCW